MKEMDKIKPKCDPHNCIRNYECKTCPAKWIPKDSECKDSEIFNCDNYNTCDECPSKEPNTWPRKDNLHILLALSDKEKVAAFNGIVKRFVAAKDVRDIEIWIANVLEFYIKKNIYQKDDSP